MCVFIFLQMKGDLKWRHVRLLTLLVGKGLKSLKTVVSRNIFPYD